jgi:peptide/nickel transport system substrate-binding protein
MRRAALAVTLVAVGLGLLSAPSTAQESPGTTLRIPFPGYDGSLTPYTFRLGYPLVMLVYDTLLWRDAEGIPRPWLAHSVERSNGGRRVTVHLREGVRWHDGRPLTADDVAFTFELVADRSPSTPELADVERVRTTNRLTVAFDLRRPSLGFDHQPLADLPIVPKHLWQGLGGGHVAPAGLPVGSGPYRLVRAQPGTGYEFRANDAYFKGRPQVKRIDVPIIHQAERSYTALKERKVDMLPFSLPKNATDDIVGGSFGITLRTGPSYTGTAVLLNTRRPPFDRPEARRAVARSLDLERIVRNVAPAVPADRGYIHPASPWASTTPLQRFDAAGARSAVAALRLPTIRVLAPANDPVRLEAGRQVRLALIRAGASSSLTKLPPAQLARAVGETGSRPSFEAAIVSTPALVSYDPDFLNALFGSNRQAAPINYSGYRSATFDALAAKVAAAPDQRTRRAGVEAELRLLATDVPAVPLFFSQGTFAFRPAIYDGWVFVKGSGIFDKRSLLAGQAAARDRSGSDRSARPERSGSSTFSVVSAISLVVLAIALVLAAVGAVAALRRRSAERR